MKLADKPRRKTTRMSTLNLFEAIAQHVCGVDEAGRGPLAGPVVAAAVILDPRRPIDGLADSKVLTPERREELAICIRRDAIASAVGVGEVGEIDAVNILQATWLAMERAVRALQPAADFALIDGNLLPPLPIAARAIIGGDALEPAISAASIIAKTFRDGLMAQLDAVHPGYGFAEHMGYSTPRHLERLRALGPCALHRRSFAPVRELLDGA